MKVASALAGLKRGENRFIEKASAFQIAYTVLILDI